jgi:hypothetical protein
MIYILEKALQHPKPVEDSMPGCSLQTKKDEESMSTVIMRQMEDGRGDLEEETFLETSFDIIPINCPDDFIFMYPVMPGILIVKTYYNKKNFKTRIFALLLSAFF